MQPRVVVGHRTVSQLSVLSCDAFDKLTVLVCQLILGPVMVMRALPLTLATAHNAVAALLLLAVVALYKKLSG